MHTWYMEVSEWNIILLHIEHFKVIKQSELKEGLDNVFEQLHSLEEEINKLEE